MKFAAKDLFIFPFTGKRQIRSGCKGISVRVIVKQDYEIQEAKYLKQFEF